MHITLVLLGATSAATFCLAFRGARREFAESACLSASTFAALFTAYASMTTSILLAAWWSTGLLPIPRTISALGGGCLVVVGAGVYLWARFRFRSFELTWGLTLNQLITDGPYRLSRNPQVAGWLICLLGAALLGRSAAALLLLIIPVVASWFWIRVEEAALEQRFGAAYRAYRRIVRRFI